MYFYRLFRQSYWILVAVMVGILALPSLLQAQEKQTKAEIDLHNFRQLRDDYRQKHWSIDLSLEAGSQFIIHPAQARAYDVEYYKMMSGIDIYLGYRSDNIGLGIEGHLLLSSINEGVQAAFIPTLRYYFSFDQFEVVLGAGVSMMLSMFECRHVERNSETLYDKSDNPIGEIVSLDLVDEQVMYLTMTLKMDASVNYFFTSSMGVGVSLNTMLPSINLVADSMSIFSPWWLSADVSMIFRF